MARVVVIGGGIGGLSTALKIKKQLQAEDRLILIDKTNPQLYAPSLLWFLIGERGVRDISRKIPEGKFDYLQDEALEILPGKKLVKTRDSGSLSYDFLVLASGGEYNEKVFPGLKEAGYNFHTLEGAAGLREELNTFPGGEVAIMMTELPIKCSPATYEAAFLLNTLLKKKGLDGEYNITIYTPEKLPLLDISPVISEAVSKELLNQGIKVSTGCKFKDINKSQGRLIFKDFNAGFDLLIYVPPFQGSALIKNSGLGTAAGWVPADPEYLHVKDDIFALGDATHINLPSGGYLFKAGVVATLQAAVVSRNIISLLAGKLPARTYKGFFICFLDIGGGQELAGIGNTYKESGPSFRFIPRSRVWRLGKRFIEYRWRHEGVKPS